MGILPLWGRPSLVQQGLALVCINRGVEFEWAASKGDQDLCWKKAINEYDRAIQLDPTNSWTYYYRGLVRTLRNDSRAAIKDCQESIRRGPPNRYFYGGLADAYNNLGNMLEHCDENKAGALEAYNQALAIEPECARYRMDRARVRLDLGDYSGALADANIMIEGNNEFYPESYAIRGRALFALDEVHPAIESLDRAIAMSKDMYMVLDPEVYHDRGRARLRLGDKSGALRDFDQAAQGLVEQSNVSERTSPDGRYRKYEMDKLNLAIKLSPKSSSAYIARATLRHKYGVK
ncbi:MAG TPA: tetratricopeptide repeat protein [Planktothrix sp.]